MKQLKIGVVGVGNLGWNLLQHLLEKGYNVNQVVSRPGKGSLHWANKLGVDLVSDVSKLKDELDIVFLCLSDDILPEIAKKVKVDAALVHCSGSTPNLESKTQKTGVFYPYQTFTKYFPVDWKGVPIFVESNDAKLKKQLLELAKDLSGTGLEVTFDQRRAVHMAGVFGANFVNYVLVLAKRILDDQHLKFELLEPLLYETLRKAFEHGPTGSQTGPAKRRDTKMIEQHLELLKNDDDLHHFYQTFSDRILREYHEEE